jgi:hypothetical protein
MHSPRTIDQREAPAQARSLRYWAFISYSHHDQKVAHWLHGTLESYRIPRALVNRPIGDITIPRRLIPVFRDRDELPSTSDLTKTIREALAASRALIVICTGHAAASKWVNEEVRLFQAMGRSDRIFPVLVDGEPHECFPPALRLVVGPEGTVSNERAEPLAADLRPTGDGRANAPLKLIAGILGIGFDDCGAANSCAGAGASSPVHWLALWRRCSLRSRMLRLPIPAPECRAARRCGFG